MLRHFKGAAARFGRFLGTFVGPVCPVCGERNGVGSNQVRPVGVELGDRKRYRPVCIRPACNSIAGFEEAFELLTTDEEGRIVAREVHRLQRELIDVQSRGAE